MLTSCCGSLSIHLHRCLNRTIFRPVLLITVPFSMSCVAFSTSSYSFILPPNSNIISFKMARYYWCHHSLLFDWLLSSVPPCWWVFGQLLKFDHLYSRIRDFFSRYSFDFPWKNYPESWVIKCIECHLRILLW